MENHLTVSQPFSLVPYLEKVHSRLPKDTLRSSDLFQLGIYKAIEEITDSIIKTSIFDPIRALFQETSISNLYETSSLFISRVFSIATDGAKLLISDLTDAFELQKPLHKIDFSSKECILGGVLASTLLTHLLSTRLFKEDPKIARSITYGAITGACISFALSEEIGAGAVTGGLIGVLTDTAISVLTYNRITHFFKSQYKRYQVQERAQKIHEITSQIFPYVAFTLGTACVYSHVKPIFDIILQQETRSSKKTYVLKTIITSALIFQCLRSYTFPTLKWIKKQIDMKAISTCAIETLTSWGPRIATIYLIHLTTKKINN